jgi:hypothetical protein
MGRCLVATLLINSLLECPSALLQHRRQILVVAAIGLNGRSTTRLEAA